MKKNLFFIFTNIIVLTTLLFILTNCSGVNPEKHQENLKEISNEISPRDSICKVNEIISNNDEHFNKILKSITSNNMNYGYIYKAFAYHINNKNRVSALEEKGQILYELGPGLTHILRLNTNIDTKSLSKIDDNTPIKSINIIKVYQEDPNRK